MSRIGKTEIELPDGVEVAVDGDVIVISGPKGEIKREKPGYIELKINDATVVVENKSNSTRSKQMHGTMRAHIANMIKGVSGGWSKKLEMVGTGYRAQVSGKKLTLTVGFSHPVEIEAPEGIEFTVEKNIITVSGIDKDLVGSMSAKIRDIRPPEPYKGKGIKYEDEEIIRKPGKAAKAAGTGTGA